MTPVREHRVRLLAAFFAVYVIWGSTYLAIRFAIETLPPFLMAGLRFVVAGTILYGWARWRGAGRPSRSQWGAAALVGTLLIVGGNGAVVWAEQRVASGVVALIVATEPFWVVLLDWIRPDGHRPTMAVVVGLLAGFIGVGLLVSPADLISGGPVDLAGAVVVFGGAGVWAAGSLYAARSGKLPRSPMLSTGMQMLVGGSLMALLGTATGEVARFDPAAVSLKSVVALVYLLIFGAIIGFTAYVYLLQHTTPARASTYAYVNPMIAVFLGWLLADESLSPRVMVAALVILSAVALIVARHTSAGEPPSATRPSREPADQSAARA